MDLQKHFSFSVKSNRTLIQWITNPNMQVIGYVMQISMCTLLTVHTISSYFCFMRLQIIHSLYRQPAELSGLAPPPQPSWAVHLDHSTIVKCFSQNLQRSNCVMWLQGRCVTADPIILWPHLPNKMGYVMLTFSPSCTSAYLFGSQDLQFA